jgi:hypothetical protein
MHSSEFWQLYTAYTAYYTENIPVLDIPGTTIMSCGGMFHPEPTEEWEFSVCVIRGRSGARSVGLLQTGITVITYCYQHGSALQRCIRVCALAVRIVNIMRQTMQQTGISNITQKPTSTGNGTGKGNRDGNAKRPTT